MRDTTVLIKFIITRRKDNFEAMKNAYQQLNTDYASVSSELDELERSCTERNTKLTAVEVCVLVLNITFDFTEAHFRLDFTLPVLQRVQTYSRNPHKEPKL